MKPFSEIDPISKLDEKQLILRICSLLGDCMPNAPFGAGDDCAVIASDEFASNDLLATSDAVILGRHFDENTDPILVGRKLVNRNASDIASMGGSPLYALTSGILSKNISLQWLDAFTHGIAEAADGLGIKVVGGDVATAAGDFFSMHMTLMGSAPLRPLLRSGAEVGDAVYVTGSLGLSFESGRHLTFAPRICEGRFLASLDGVSSCTDLSDGFASDVKNILQKNAAVEIYEDSFPCAEFAGRKATLREALCGGEDYELLFTFRGDKKYLENQWSSAFKTQLREVGKIIFAPVGAEKGILVVGTDGARRIFQESGFNHLA